jgi:hypothetical protein
MRCDNDDESLVSKDILSNLLAIRISNRHYLQLVLIAHHFSIDKSIQRNEDF